MMHEFRHIRLLGALYFLFFLFLYPLRAIPLDPHDEGGKYVYLPSMLFDRDLDFANQRKGYNYALPITDTGLSYHQWSIGSALLWSPFFLLGHGLALAFHAAGSPWTLDGFSFPYYLAVSLGTLLYGWAGLLLLYAVLRRAHGPGVSCLAAGTALFASQASYYTFCHPIHDHGLVFAGMSLVLWAFYRLRELPDRLSSWTLLGTATGLVMALRPDTPLILPALIVALTPHLRPRTLPGVACFAASMLFFYAPQPLANRLFHGAWIGSGGDPNHSMNDFWRSFGPGMFLEGTRWRDLLFHPVGGVLLQTPWVALGVLGLLLRLRRDPAAGTGWLLYATFVLTGLLTLTDGQHPSNALISRYLFNAGPMLALGLAESVALLRRAGFLSRAAALAGAALSIAWQALRNREAEDLRSIFEPDLLWLTLSEFPRQLAEQGVNALARPGSVVHLVLGGGSSTEKLSWILTILVPMPFVFGAVLFLIAKGRERFQAQRLWAGLTLAALAVSPILILEIRHPVKSEERILASTLERLELALTDPWGYIAEANLLDKARSLSKRLGKGSSLLDAYEGFLHYRKGQWEEAGRFWEGALEGPEGAPLARVGLAQLSELRGDPVTRDRHLKALVALGDPLGWVARAAPLFESPPKR